MEISIRRVEPGDYILVAHSGDTFLGFGGLHAAAKSSRRSHAMHLGITVGGEWQGKGVGRRLMAALLDLADNWLNVLRSMARIRMKQAPV